MTCPKCGKEFDETATVCPHCGETVAKSYKMVGNCGYYEGKIYAKQKGLIALILGAVANNFAWVGPVLIMLAFKGFWAWAETIIGLILAGVSMGLSIYALKMDKTSKRGAWSLVIAIVALIGAILGIVVLALHAKGLIVIPNLIEKLLPQA